MSGRVLVVDDDQSMCDLIESNLTRKGFGVKYLTSPSEAYDLLQREDFDAVLTDLKMRGMNGIELCERIVANRPDIPVVVITAFGSLETAVAAIRAGAYDFVTKPFQMEALKLTMERAVQHRALREQVRFLERAVEEARRFDEIIGSSRPMKKLYDRLNRIADSGASVVINGESGSGKELVAKALHNRGPRQDSPFVAINCAAVPEPLLESELFGHTKGAFTDAKSSRKGLLLEADGGTLFLDEIADMPISLQPKFLRALEERKVRPVGGNHELSFSVRIVAATNRDLEIAVDEGRFREDLLFRINVIRIDVPPLRARGRDILLLAKYFVDHFAAEACKTVNGISRAAAEKLLNYKWPGNVRELRNCIEHAIALTRFEQLAVEDLPEKVQSYEPSHVIVQGSDPEELIALEEVERRYIQHVLQVVGQNKNLASRILGIDRTTLYRKLDRYKKAEG